MNQPNNAVVVDTCTKRLNALKAHVSNKAEIMINGKAHKAAAVFAIYQTCLDTRAALSTKRADIKAILVETANAESLRRAADTALKPWVINTYGANSQQAHDFGFPPPKAPTRSVENKADAKALAKATRVARHTMGKKEKLKIKGVITPTVPAAPAPQTVQTAAPPVVSTPAPVAVAPAPVAPAPAPANGVAPVQNGAPHA